MLIATPVLLRVLHRIVVSAVPRCVRTGCLAMAAATTRGDVAGTVPHVRRRAVELRHVARHCVRRHVVAGPGRCGPSSIGRHDREHDLKTSGQS